MNAQTTTTTRTTTPLPMPAKRMTLAAVKRGRVEQPLRVVLYGPEGIGKSTFAANAPAPIFLGAEDGTAQLDVARFPEPRAWADVFDAVRELTTAEHSYQTLAIDTLDWLEPTCWEHVCKTGGKADIEAFGYGKGYVAALEEWRRLLAALDALRARCGMHVVILAHAHVKPFNNPDGENFDRYTMKVHEKAAGLVKEWSDAVLFAQYETFTKKDGAKSKGFSTGARVVHTERRAAWDAKNRFGLPETIALDWESFFASVAAAMAPSNAEAIRARIGAAEAEINDATVSGWLATNVPAAGDDTGRLTTILNRLQARLAQAAGQ